MIISMIAAIGKNRELGKNNKLLWSIKEDMQWFRAHTMNKPVVMGRKTYESIGKPLKNRLNIVLTRDMSFNPDPNVLVAHDIGNVLYHVKDEKEVMIIGGAEIYKQFLPFTNRMYLTEIDKEFEADTFFPEFDKSKWGHYFHKEGSEDVGFNYSFNVYKKKGEKG